MEPSTKLASLLESDALMPVPQIGDLVKGRVLSTKGRRVLIDINGMTTGVVRGRELFTDSETYSSLKVGDVVEATVVDLDNEHGEIELSFRYAGNKKAWEELKESFEKNESVKAKVLDANKGGLLIQVKSIRGFLPVSQLSPDNYPRVSGGDKTKILDKLNSFVDTKLDVKILDLNETDEKLIVSEKAVWEAEQKTVINQIAVGQTIEGEVTALADFGAFVKFSPKGDENTSLEGLVHISEIAWQRIDHPKDILKSGQTIKAEIIGIEGSKIFLSIKNLMTDPWQEVQNKYKVGDVVEGTVLKINPFGLFVELDADIHGLAHVSELSSKPIDDPKKVATIGEKRSFKIVSIEPKEHRLGLSIKALDQKEELKAEAKAEKATEADAEVKVEEATEATE